MNECGRHGITSGGKGIGFGRELHMIPSWLQRDCTRCSRWHKNLALEAVTFVTYFDSNDKHVFTVYISNFPLTIGIDPRSDPREDGQT